MEEKRNNPNLKQKQHTSLPPKVKEKFDELKRKFNAKLTFSHVKDKYYVYEYTIWVNPITEKKNVIKMMYIGNINIKGEFTPAKRRRNNNYINSTEAMKRYEFLNSFTKKEIAILRSLSMDARITKTELASRINSKPNTVIRMIEQLNERLGLTYFAQVNLKKLGFLRYMLFINFLNEKPTIKEIKESFENDPRVLLVATLSNKYDLMIYFTVENNILLMDFIYKWQNNKLQKYKAVWTVTPVSQFYGGVKIREPFFELLKERIWHRTREQPRKLPWQLTESEFKILRDLTIDGSMQFKELALNNGLSSPAASSYVFEKLKEREIIQRITISMDNIPLRYYAMYFIKIIDRENYNKHDREGLIKEELDYKYSWINKYSLAVDIGIPVGEIYIAPILNEEDFQAYEQILKYFKSIEVESVLITNIIIGSIINRNFDNTYAPGYKVLVEEY
ncbi:MAG: winged helix-turn-helix transcriptional regulator, partial [Candidatus Micrarchaeia archaeon]